MRPRSFIEVLTSGYSCITIVKCGMQVEHIYYVALYRKKLADPQTKPWVVPGVAHGQPCKNHQNLHLIFFPDN